MTTSNSVVHTFHFGHPTTTNPATFTCPPNGSSTYNASTGLCSAWSGSSSQFCAYAPGFTPNINTATETYIAGLGCVWDQDNDGILGHIDNCPDILNPDQADGDTDGVGDMCDV